MNSKKIKKRDFISQVIEELRYCRQYTDRRIARHLSALNIKDFLVLLEVFEDIIFDNLSSANENESVVISLFDGFQLKGTYLPCKEKKNNLTGETILTKSKIKPKVKIARSYCEKLSETVN